MGKQTTFLVEVMPFIGGQLVIWQSMQLAPPILWLYFFLQPLTKLFVCLCLFVCLVWDVMGKQTMFLVEVMPFIGGQLVIWQSMQLPQFCGFIFFAIPGHQFGCLIWNFDMVVLHLMDKQTTFLIELMPFIRGQLVIWRGGGGGVSLFLSRLMGKRTTFLVQVINAFHLRPISYLAVNVVAPPILWLYFFSIP